MSLFSCLPKSQFCLLSSDGIHMNGTLPSELSAVSTLADFSIANENLLVGTIPSEIGLMSKLTFLQFYGTGMAGTIPESMTALANLKRIALARNNVSGTIPDLFGGVLLEMYLQFNDFEGTLPPIKAHSKLRWLVLTDNSRLTGTLPSSFYAQPDLEWVAFAGTGLGGTIAPQISELTNMIYFQAANAGFSGSIPSSIGNLDRLL
jgi:hypothetical protein